MNKLTALLLVVCLFAAVQRSEGGCVCPRSYIPVCASNQETYANKCLFECARDELLRQRQVEIRIVSQGACGAPIEPSVVLE